MLFKARICNRWCKLVLTSKWITEPYTSKHKKSFKYLITKYERVMHKDMHSTYTHMVNKYECIFEFSNWITLHYSVVLLEYFCNHIIPTNRILSIYLPILWSIFYLYLIFNRQTAIEKFCVHTKLNPNVVLVRIFPSMRTETIAYFLQPPIEGVVLQCYGAGNVPNNRKDIMNHLKEATERGVIILSVTQCINGSVSGLYATGKALLDIGIIPGSFINYDLKVLDTVHKDVVTCKYVFFWNCVCRMWMYSRFNFNLKIVLLVNFHCSLKLQNSMQQKKPNQTKVYKYFIIHYN